MYTLGYTIYILAYISVHYAQVFGVTQELAFGVSEILILSVNEIIY